MALSGYGMLAIFYSKFQGYHLPFELEVLPLSKVQKFNKIIVSGKFPGTCYPTPT